jgi:hypothetical protein
MSAPTFFQWYSDKSADLLDMCACTGIANTSYHAQVADYDDDNSLCEEARKHMLTKAGKASWSSSPISLTTKTAIYPGLGKAPTFETASTTSMNSRDFDDDDDDEDGDFYLRSPISFEDDTEEIYTRLTNPLTLGGQQNIFRSKPSLMDPSLTEMNSSSTHLIMRMNTANYVIASAA